MKNKFFILLITVSTLNMGLSQGDSLGGGETGFITETLALDMIEEYADKNPNATRYYYHGRDVLDSILSVQDIVGLIIYTGLDSNNKKTSIIIGVYDDGSANVSSPGDLSFPCPPLCLGEGSGGTPQDPKGESPPP